MSTVDTADDLTRKVQELERELAEARQQQAGTSDILRVISGSTTDITRVFDTIARSAARLCEAFDVIVLRVDGSVLRLVAHYGPMPAGDVPLHRGTLGGRTVIERRLIHIEDLQTEIDEFPEGSAIARERGHRTTLSVPLLKDGAAIGNIQVRRNEVRLFSDQQISLLKTFADQAVIAIENTRLFEEVQARNTELRIALEQQTATSDILRVIGRSPTDVQPIFDTLAENAIKLCEAERATIYRFDGEFLRLVAAHNVSLELRAFIERNPPSPARGTASGRAALQRCTIQIHDVQADPEYSYGSRLIDPIRTMLAVPMLRAGELLGVMNIYRLEVRPFTDGQIALMETFADQAVIAIENTRLFEAEQASKRALTEALEYQTATSKVLSVIGSSPGDLAPVFDAMLTNAVRICEAKFGVLFRYDGNVFQPAATLGVPPAYTAFLQERGSFRPTPGAPIHRLLQTEELVHITDNAAEQYPGPAGKYGGARSLIAVPMRKEKELVGAFVIYRTEVRPFTDKQIELVKGFANQAVIAIENVRLLNELRESLQQQTATADVLKVISRSALDVQKVLEALVESAARLCDAYDAVIFQVVGDGLRIVAHHGTIPTLGPVGQHTLPLAQGLITGRAVIDRRMIHVADILAEGVEYPEGREGALQLGTRTALAVPLIHAGEAIGVIYIRRAEVRPFTERQIELVNTFADQAVIAIENTRLFEQVQARTNELQRTLEYQTATSEVLEVIGRSPTDLQPVFDAIAQSAARLCNAQFCHLFRFDGQLTHLAAVHGLSPEGREALRSIFPMPPGRATAAARAILSGAIEEIPDVTTDFDYAYADIAKIITFRSIVAVPMIKDGRPIGAIAVARSETGHFPKQQIELLRTFADQAVIAIENTRLFEAEQASKRELQESLEQQTATADVLEVISRSKFDVQPVLDELVASAAKLCQAEIANIWRPNGAEYRLAASYGVTSQREDWLAYRKYLAGVAYRPGRGSVVGRTLLEGRTIQIDDIRRDPDYDQRGALAGVRTMLGVPLLRDGRPIGVMVLVRAAARRFTDKQVELIETFADQAVIAIENARLFEEVQARTRELAKTVEDLEIASQHKNQFVANMSHELRTPLAAILGYAELIQEGFYGALPEKSLNALTRIRSNGKHLLGLINTVLDIAKIESGQFTLNMSEYAIESVVETVRAATESLAHNKKLTLTTSVDKSLPVGLGDEQRLTQVLLNLVGNAIKFTDAGEVSIAAGARNGLFAVSVTDTGPGIPLDQQDRIFEQFHQVDSSMTKTTGGTGLGLAIAKQIVEMHGGRIWVESTVGKGSTFQMQIPTHAVFRKLAL